MLMCQLFVVLLLLYYCSGELAVVVHRGAFIRHVPGIILYNDVELLHHIITDMPLPPSSIVTPCARGASAKACSLSTHLHKILEGNAAVLTLLNKARTSSGLQSDELKSISLSNNSFRAVKENHIVVDPADDEIIKLAGRDWYADVQALLDERRPGFNSTAQRHRMSKRFVQYIKPLLIGGAALLGADDLLQFISSLFVGEGGLAKFLALIQATSPEQNFVDLSRKVSKFESATRQLLGDLALEAEEVNKITEGLQYDVLRHQIDLSTIEDSQIAAQQMLADMGSMQFTFGIYFSLMHADAVCRSGYLSPLLVPPQLLAEKLTTIASLLPSDLKLALGLDQLQAYYTTKSSKCMYDSHGGLTTISVPIVHKSADYQLYEYRNMFFSWESKTCTLESTAEFIIKDVKGNKVYPVEDVDEERCSPHLTKRCKIPPESDSAEAYCLTTLMSSSTVSQIREACKMTCFDKKDTVVSQLANNLFVAIHVPKNSLTIECPQHEVYNITEEVEYGSLRIITNCACTIRLHKKTIGRSTGPVCQGHESVTIDVLLPGHWTTLTDLQPFTYDGNSDGTTFQHQSEIFNKHAMDVEEVNESFFTTEVSVITLVWNFLHSFILVYMMFRLNIINGAGLVTGLSAARIVEASTQDYCKLEDEVYYILYVICAMCTLAFIPPVIMKFYNFLTKQFYDAVDVMTERRLADNMN